MSSTMSLQPRASVFALALAAAGMWLAPASAQAQMGYAATERVSAPFGQAMRPAPYEAIEEEQGAPELAAHLRRQIVPYQGRDAAGTIVVDTANTYLYFVLGNGSAVRYGIGVGREGFTWSGTETISRKAEWPDWTPPDEMIARQPYLPRFMAGGPGNPLGARAMYLGGSIYRIHGTNQPSSIGQQVSSGCIRMLNADVVDLYERAGVGAKVVVLPARARNLETARDSRPAPRGAAAMRTLSSSGIY